jgi:hypothetical protein
MEVTIQQDARDPIPNWYIASGSGGNNINVASEYSGLTDPTSAAAISNTSISCLRGHVRPNISPYVSENYGWLDWTQGIYCSDYWGLVCNVGPLYSGVAFLFGTKAENARNCRKYSIGFNTAAMISGVLSQMCDWEHHPEPRLQAPATIPNVEAKTRSAFDESSQVGRSTSSDSLLTRNLSEIESALQLTRSQLSQALLVKRATLYKWFRGAQPRQRTAVRIGQLTQLAREWRAAGLGSARGSWYLRVSGAALSFGEMLTAKSFEVTNLRALIGAAAKQPGDLEMVEPAGIEGFPAENEAEERRRRRDLFPPTFVDKE